MRTFDRVIMKLALIASTGISAWSRIGIWIQGAAYLAVVLFANSAHRCRAEGDEGLKKAIFDAWAKRQTTTKSVKFEWTQNGEIRLSGILPETGNTIRKHFPENPEFVEVRQTSSLRLDGDRLDYRADTIDGEKLSMPKGSRSAFDGLVSQRYTGIARPNTVGSGIITDEAHAFGTTVFYVRPLILQYRPLHPSISQVPKHQQFLRALPDKIPIDGHLCVLLEEMAENLILHQYYVDPENQYVVRRYATRVEGRDSNRIDISYERDPDHGMIPTKWECVSLDGEGKFDSSRMCTVTNYEINQPIPLEEFRIEFPKGTHVHDRVNGRKYVVGQDGNLAGARRAWFLGLNAGCVTLLIVLFTLRRRKKQST